MPGIERSMMGNVEIAHVAHGHGLATFRMSADGRRLLTYGGRAVKAPTGISLPGTGRPTVRLWDMPSRRELARLIPDLTVTAACFTADSGRFATASGSGQVQVWRAASRLETTRRIRAPPSRLFRLASPGVQATAGEPEARGQASMTPDGALMAAACTDGTLRLLDPGRAQHRRQGRGHHAGQGPGPAAGDVAGRRRPGPARRDRLRHAPGAPAGRRGVRSEWSLPRRRHHDPDGVASFLVLFSDKRVRVFDVTARAEVAAWEVSHPGVGVAVGFSRDSRHVLTAAAEAPLAEPGASIAGLGGLIGGTTPGITVREALWQPADLIAAALDALPETGRQLTAEEASWFLPEWPRPGSGPAPPS